MIKRGLVILLLLIYAPMLSAAEDSIRDILKSQKPIWYDSAADDWRRIAAKAPEPPERTSPNTNSDLSAVFVYLMIAVIVVASAYLLFQLIRNLTIDASVPLEEVRKAAVARAVADLSALPFTDKDIQDPEAALLDARKQQDWRRAIAWSYALHLVELDQAGIITLTKGTTNKGYLRSVITWSAESPKRVVIPQTLSVAISTFERTWFGHHQADEEILLSLEGARIKFIETVKREGLLST